MKLTILFISIVLLAGCASTPISEMSNSVVCHRAIYRDDRDAAIEAENRFRGGVNSNACISLADRHQEESMKAAASIGKDLGTILKNTTR